MYGELEPLGGGDTIVLPKRSLLVGRRESCDIVLRFATFRRIIASSRSTKAIGTLKTCRAATA